MEKAPTCSGCRALNCPWSIDMKPTDLRGILRYIPRFRLKTFVISVDGAIVADENFANILLDIAVLRSLNIRVILAHGASAQIKKLAAQQSLEPSNLSGDGVTDDATMRLAVSAANRLTHDILEKLSVHDLRAAWCNAVTAHPVGIIGGVNQQQTGKVERIDIELLTKLLDEGIVPVIPPLGFDGAGATFRLNSDTAARAVAEAIGAVKLIYITTRDGLIRHGELMRQVQASDLESILAENDNGIEPDLISKAAQSALACKNGIPRAHIINGYINEGLLTEVFSNEGIGTLIFANEYRAIRRAKKKDIRSILNLTKASVKSEELVKRTRSQIEADRADYYIYEIDKNPIACVALHVYADGTTGELAFLCVNPSHENQGIGSKMVQFVESAARQMGLARLITVSAQTFSFFTKHGFVEASSDDLPQERREQHQQTGRNSKILFKELVSPAA